MRFSERHLRRSPYSRGAVISPYLAALLDWPHRRKPARPGNPLTRQRGPRHNRAFGGAMKPHHLALKVSEVRLVLAKRPVDGYICDRCAANRQVSRISRRREGDTSAAAFIKATVSRCGQPAKLQNRLCKNALLTNYRHLRPVLPDAMQDRRMVPAPEIPANDGRRELLVMAQGPGFPPW